MIADCGLRIADSNTRCTPSRMWSVALVLCSFALITHHSASPAEAAPSAEDIFRSVADDGRGRGQDRGHATALLMCGAGGLILLLLLGTRRAKRQAAPQPLNHSRKLMREMMKAVPLRRAELKQLKLLAEASASGGGGDALGEPVHSPLTLLLCPSVLARALKNRPPKVDRAVIARIVRKMDLAPRSR